MEQKRTPKGASGAGQFAATAHAEPDMSTFTETAHGAHGPLIGRPRSVRPKSRYRDFFTRARTLDVAIRQRRLPFRHPVDRQSKLLRAVKTRSGVAFWATMKFLNDDSPFQ